MALQGFVTTSAGRHIEDQYIRIEGIDIRDRNTQLVLTVGYYDSKPSDSSEFPYETTFIEVPYDINSVDNTVKQGYNELKKYPPFDTDHTDV